MTFRTISHQLLVALLIVTMSVSSLVFLPTKRAQAVAVPTQCGLFDVFCIMDNWKNFVGDRLAVMVANQLIQRMTASVVNWINTGFEGSPAFLNNPEGFFLDVGDQITGELISKTGALADLCQPFSFDIRLNLAINQVDMSSYNKRYTCTLGKVIQNTQNAVSTAGQNSGITLTGSADGVTLGNFMNGDFSQGGLEGFLVYTTQPQNNPIGAYLLAKSDLEQKIAEKKAAVNTDLNRGQGFLSWQKCTDVPDYETASMYAGDSVENLNQALNLNTIKPSNVRKVKDQKTGKEKYQRCEVKTPGSVIAGSLQRQLNVPTDKLVLVKTISDSIDAITGALVNQMFTQGLAALSDRGSGIGNDSRSYLSQLSDESYNQNSFDIQSTKNRSLSSANSIINLGQDNINQYDQSLVALNTVRARYVTARSCFSISVLNRQNLSNSQRAYAQQLVTGIDMVINQNIDPLIATTTAKKEATQNALSGYRNTADTTTNAQIRGVTDSDISLGFNRIDQNINATIQGAKAGVESANDVQTGKSELDSLLTMLNNDASTFMGICNQMPYQSSYNLNLPYHRFQNPLLLGFY